MARAAQSLGEATACALELGWWRGWVREEAAPAGFALVRDAVIDSRPGEGDLAAQAGDFWFHTDGCFMTEPPRLLAIVLVEAGPGGALSLLDARAALSHDGGLREAARGEAFFGLNGRGVRTPAFVPRPPPGVFRYRRDYMEDAPQALHEAVARAASDAHELGELRRGEWLIVDNWRLLHRRGPFTGRRRIRRLWWASRA